MFANRLRSILVLAAAAALAGAGVPAVLGSGTAGAITITVTAGKPSEYSFTLTKKTVTVGTVVFKVVNAGKVRHDFEIAGRTTPLLRPGRSATLTVAFAKAGAFSYSSSVPGQAAHGMSGTLTVGAGVQTTATTTAAVTTTASTPATTTSTTVTSAAAAVPVSEPCASPSATTVNVAIFDFGFTLSRTTVPCGQVTFVVVNTGQVFHNFDVEVPVANGRQGFLGSENLLGGESETQTASYTRTGLYRYQCDLHWVQGQMIGVLTVTQ